MTSHEVSHFLLTSLEVMSTVFIFTIGLLVVVVFVLYVVDVSQHKDAIRHNFPVIGRFRYLFSHLGKFFRQYFFAMDREELPFNRAQREWVYDAARDAPNTRAFGSTKDILAPGSIVFMNCPFPTLDTDAVPPHPVTIGEACATPFTTAAIVNISGMSYGALSRPAVQALSRGAFLGQCWLNTGEGGLSPWHLEGGADLVFQIGTAKYGVRDEAGRLSEERLRAIAAHPQVRMFEIKISQGAKPGKGGILPAVKVTEEIARIRGIRPHEDSISPNRHPELNSNDDILDMVERVRRATGKPTGIKLVLGDPGWIDGFCQSIVRRGARAAPDFITIDGAEGGSGAAPMSLMDAVGLSIREALPAVVDALVIHGLREQVKVIASGKLVTPVDVAWALCIGADFVNSARGFLFALGCIQALQCNRNTCPTGITTHNPRLQAGLDVEDKARRVASYVKNLHREVGIIAHSCCVPEPRKLCRCHARIVMPDGRSLGLHECHPDKVARDEGRGAR